VPFAVKSTSLLKVAALAGSAPHENRSRRPGHLAVLVRRLQYHLDLPAKRAPQFRGALPGFPEEVLTTLEPVYALSHCLWRFAEVFVVGVRIPLAEHEDKLPSEALLQ